MILRAAICASVPRHMLAGQHGATWPASRNQGEASIRMAKVRTPFENANNKHLAYLRAILHRRAVGCLIFLVGLAVMLAYVPSDMDLRRWTIYWLCCQAAGVVGGIVGGFIGGWGEASTPRLLLLGLCWLGAALPAQWVTSPVLGADGAEAYCLGVLCGMLIGCPKRNSAAPTPTRGRPPNGE